MGRIELLEFWSLQNLGENFLRGRMRLPKRVGDRPDGGVLDAFEIILHETAG